MLEKLDF